MIFYFNFSIINIEDKKYMEENLPEIVKPKLDIIFKRIFGDVKNKEIVMRFLSDMLEIPLFFFSFRSERSLII